MISQQVTSAIKDQRNFELYVKKRLIMNEVKYITGNKGGSFGFDVGSVLVENVCIEVF